MSLCFTNNDLQIRTQFLKRLHSNGLHLGANLNSFDYSFVEYTRFNIPFDGKYFRLNKPTINSNTYFLGDLTYGAKFDDRGGYLVLLLNVQPIYDIPFGTIDKWSQQFFVKNILFDSLVFKDIYRFNLFPHFVGIKVTMKI